VYGMAEFQPGESEPEEPTMPVQPVPPTDPTMPVQPEPVFPGDDGTDITAAGSEGLSLMQKGIFLVVILACVAIYVRINTSYNGRGVYSRV